MEGYRTGNVTQLPRASCPAGQPVAWVQNLGLGRQLVCNDGLDAEVIYRSQMASCPGPLPSMLLQANPLPRQPDAALLCPRAARPPSHHLTSHCAPTLLHETYPEEGGAGLGPGLIGNTGNALAVGRTVDAVTLVGGQLGA